MKLLILGATGGIGIEIVRQALDRGHNVTAFVRKPERLEEFGERISIETGNLLNAADLERVMRGHDAVLSAFGPRVPIAKSDAHLLRDFGAALTNAMSVIHQVNPDVILIPVNAQALAVRQDRVRQRQHVEQSPVVLVDVAREGAAVVPRHGEGSGGHIPVSTSPLPDYSRLVSPDI